MPQTHYQKVCHMSGWITYILNTARCHKLVTKRFITCQAESHTYWTEPDATNSSARHSTHVKPNHLLPEHSQMPQNHHQEILHMSKSLTNWTQPDATKSSPRGSVHVKLNHLQAEQNQMPQNHHQELLHMSSLITYILNTARCHKIITKSFCTCQAKSLTSWTQPDATNPSPRGSEYVKLNHLHTEHRCHKIITKRSVYVKLNHLHPEHPQVPHNHHQMFCTCQAEPLTCWMQSDTTESSAGGSVHVKLNHIHSKHGQMP